MRVLSYLVLLLMFSVASGQTPTILQGDYISNVFGNSNFILNPNAQTSNCTTSGTITCANVTVTNASITRVTTTPLVARTEFNVAITSANGTATWATRAFDAGMKGQNCEARFTYRGFAATSKVHIKQGANTVATLNLTPATDPRIASINFPCGDLSAATTFVVTDTAILAGTNEIGAIYTGLATNMANVAQAENVVQASRSASQSILSGTPTVLQYNIETKDVYGEFDTANGRFTAKRAGDYLINSAWLFDSFTWTAGQYYEMRIHKNGNAMCKVFKEAQANRTMYFGNEVTCTVTLAVGDYLETVIDQNRGTSTNNAGQTYNYTLISRFPTSSELVVTPERQNTWAGAQFTGGAVDLTNTTIGNYVTYNNAVAASFTPFGSASASKTSCTYGGGGSVGANDVALCIPVIPPGTYKVTFQTRMSATTSTADCNFRFSDGTTGFGMLNVSNAADNTLIGIIKYNSLTLNRGIAVQSNNGGAGGACNLLVAATSNDRTPQFLFEPLDQPSNSALFVEGPVKASATGAAIPAGYVGETISELGTTDLTINTTSGGTSTTLLTKSIPVGVWMLIPAMHCKENSGFTGEVRAGIKITTSNTDTWGINLAITDGQVGLTIPNFSGTAAEFSQDVSGIPLFVNLTSPTTYYMRGTTYNNTLTGSVLCRAILKGVRLN